MQNRWECDQTHPHSYNVYAAVGFKIAFLSLLKITWLPFAALLLYNSLLPLFVYSHLLRARSFSLLAEIHIAIHTAMLLFSVSHDENLTASICSISWRSSCIPHTLFLPLFVSSSNSSKGTPLSFCIHPSPRLVLQLFEAVSSCVLLAWIHLCLFKLLQSFRYPVFSSQHLLFLSDFSSSVSKISSSLFMPTSQASSSSAITCH